MKPKSQQRLGVAFHRGGVEVAEVAAENGSGWRVLRQATFPMEAAPTAEAGAQPVAPAWPLEKLKAFRPSRGPLNASVITGLDSADVLCRVITLPTANEEELNSMLELQLENLSPLPVEQIVYGYEVIRKGEKQTDVFVAMAVREKVQQRLEILRQAGLPADVLDIEPLALLSWLQHQRVLSPQDLDHLALVSLEEEVATLILTHAGKPQFVAAVPLRGIGGASHAETAAAAAQLIAEELRLAMTAVEASQPEARWPRVRVLPAPAAGETARFDAAYVAVALGEATGLPCEPLQLSQPPSIALGFCLRHGPNAEARTLNLMPSDVLAEKEQLVRRQRMKRWIVIIAALYALMVIAVLGGIGWKMSVVSSLQSELNQVAPGRDRVKTLMTDLKVLQEHVNEVNVPMECLNEIARLKPESIFLTEVNFVDGETVTLSGFAPNASAVTDEFNPKLEKSPLFPGGTKMAPLLNQKIRGSEAVRFSITCNLKKGEATTTRRSDGKRRR